MVGKNIPVFAMTVSVIRQMSERKSAGLMEVHVKTHCYCETYIYFMKTSKISAYLCITVLILWRNKYKKLSIFVVSLLEIMLSKLFHGHVLTPEYYLWTIRFLHSCAIGVVNGSIEELVLFSPYCHLLYSSLVVTSRITATLHEGFSPVMFYSLGPKWFSNISSNQSPLVWKSFLCVKILLCSWKFFPKKIGIYLLRSR